ncbi:SCO7613 C-terminal domain-containing membrane protein [Streptomyces nitrosporeus]|uniref:SCO7613 C-terminal domain-containing membrane protein n=1 Tax=Streptomyces nitrosporeus TaxID=28894 RepID=UPI0039A3D263
MTHVPPPAEELVLLDRELARLDARRLQLLHRRAWLLSVLGPVVAPPPRPPARAVSGPGPAAPPVWGAPVPAGPAAVSGGPGAVSGGPGAQNVLLVLGGLLLAVAAIAFTLFSWGEMGIAGRSAVLAAVTAGALAAPAALLRRGLTSTAEALAAVALLLTVLDAYALHAVALPDADGLAFAATAAAVLAGGWAVYGVVLGRLRLPLPAAVVAAQLPLVLGAAAADASALVTGWALLLTAAADLALVLRGGRLAVRMTAGAGAGCAGPLALLTAVFLSLSAGGVAGAVGPGVLLLAGAGVAAACGWRAPREWAVAAGAVAGSAAVAAVGGVVRPGVPGNWATVVYLLCAAALVPVLRVRAVPRPLGGGVLGASAAVAGCAVLWALPVTAVALLGPVEAAAGPWSGAPEGLRAASGSPAPWQGGAAPVALLVAAALLGWLCSGRALSGAPGAVPGARVRTAAGAGALGLVWCVVPAVLLVADAPYAVAVAVELLSVAGLLAWAVRREPDAVTGTALGCAGAGAVGAGLLAAASEPATYAVFLVLAAVCTVTAVRAGALVVRAALAVGAVLCAVVPAVCVGVSLGWGAYGAVVVLAVPAATVVLGARLRQAAVALSVEGAGASGALVAVVVAVPRPPVLALVLALAGVLAAATALRAARRPFAGYLAAVLFVLASWVRLAASEVAEPEAYTLPVSVAAFAVGLLRRRRDAETSSWAAYGPALGVTLVPSLMAAWGDPHWLRPLVLGAAALAVTLVGAHRRLQAPLVLGGAVLALDALHELAPHVVQVFDALPRWAFPALAGLLLLAVGATYEQRLRDARRVRESLGRMR